MSPLAPTAALRNLRRELCDFSARPVPLFLRARNPLLRRLPLVTASLFAVFLVAAGSGPLAERLPVEQATAIAVGLTVLTAAPVVLVLFRPMAAWWLSLLAVVPGAVLGAALSTPPPAGTPWPWTEAGVLAHTTVTVLVAWRIGAPGRLVLWLLTLLEGALLGTRMEPGQVDLDLPLLATLCAVGLTVVGVLRGRRDARLRLRRQENLTEIERKHRTLLEERTRIARELHDVVAHHMSLVAVQAEAAPYRVTDPPQELTESFSRIRENALAALTEMRVILGMLRSDEGATENRYTPQPTLENLDELVDNVRGSGLRIDIRTTGGPVALPQRVELSAFRIVQEALSNVVRHAPGSSVRVDLTYAEDVLGLRVVNTAPAGPAHGPAKQEGTGHGVVGMRERASILGGRLRVGPTDDGGYEVTASLPVDGSERA